MLAVPKFVLRHIFAPAKAGKLKHLDAFTYGVWLVANIHLKSQPRGAGTKPAWDNVIYDSPSLGYVVASHQTLRGLWSVGMDVLPAAGRCGAERVLENGCSSCATTRLARRCWPTSDARTTVCTAWSNGIDLWRWGHAMVRPTPGFIWGGDRERAAKPIGRCHFAHSDLSGMALFEEAQQRGIAAAEAVLRARGQNFESIL